MKKYTMKKDSQNKWNIIDRSTGNTITGHISGKKEALNTLKNMQDPEQKSITVVTTKALSNHERNIASRAKKRNMPIDIYKMRYPKGYIEE